MVFSSHLFLFAFLPLCFLIYYASPPRGRALFLTLLSYVFYGWANPPWIILMLISTVLDFTCGLILVRRSGVQPDGRNYPPLVKGTHRDGIQKLVLAISVIGNLAILGFFKYFDFTAEQINTLSQLFGGEAAVPLLYVALPVGISFYTFQTMSYTIDIYRGDGRALRNPLDFACYVAMFPQLVAGPIVRYHDIDRQLVHRTHTWDKAARGCALFACGMGKKVLLANPMGSIADAAFAADGLHAWDAWYGLVAYAFQIYFDFSGYSDMAIGLGLLFGFQFIKNFDSPYHADSITNLWQRWHISLSTWLRDYLYIPLGGNRGSTYRTYGNLATVMLLGGLWHGAQWTFVIWGAIHGGMLAFERSQGKDGPYRRLPRPLRIAITFAVVCLAWIFFRAETLPEAWDYLASCLFLRGSAPAADAIAPLLYAPYLMMMFAICALVTWSAPQSWIFTHRLSIPRVAWTAVLFLASIVALWTQTENPFLYFQF